MVLKKVKRDVIKFAKKSGNFLLKEFKKVRDYSKRKHTKELKTIYDKASENLIKNLIEKNYPEHSILAEESGYLRKDSQYIWIVDPLDGTSNFVSGNPFFSVSIAFMINKKLEFGVVYAPTLKEIFTAEKNKGAFLNGRKIKVSKVSDIRKSYFVTCEGGEKSRKRKAKLLSTFAEKAIDIRKLGSAALECAWVACSRADAYITFKIRPWDVAAGILLVEEAGGKVSDFKGKEWELKVLDLVVSNGLLHKKILEIVKEKKI